MQGPIRLQEGLNTLAQDGFCLSELSQIRASVLNLSKFVKENEDSLLLRPEDIKKAGERAARNIL